MSKSAFGVEHTEFSKIAFPTGGSGAARRAAKAHRAKQRAAGARVGQGVRTGPGRLRRMGEKAVNAEISVARIGRGIGAGTQAAGQKVGSTIQRYPGTTGAAVIGAGGYGLYRSGRNKKPVTQGQA